MKDKNAAEHQQQQADKVRHAFCNDDRSRSSHGNSACCLEQVGLEQLPDLSRGDGHGDAGKKDQQAVTGGHLHARPS